MKLNYQVRQSKFAEIGLTEAGASSGEKEGDEGTTQRRSLSGRAQPKEGLPQQADLSWGGGEIKESHGEYRNGFLRRSV